MAKVVNSEIARLKKMKGSKRVWRDTFLSNALLSIDYEEYPGLGHEFLESREYKTDSGSWVEHKLLLRGYKESEIEERKNYDLAELFITIGKLITREIVLPLYKTKIKIDGYGLEEVDCSDPVSYYFLIYILESGKENIPDNYEED